jgi:release factor glutamine methyltransferase
VKNHEPRQALLAGEDGLDVIRPLIADSRRFLKPGGCLMLEIGYRQGHAVTALLRTHGYDDIEIRKDFSGHDRMVAARRGT